jgi:hypothetical protein
MTKGYEARYCAFVDILGFGELIERLRRGEREHLRVKSLLEQVHSPVRAKRRELRAPDMKAQSISDAVAISTALTGDGLVQLLFSLEQLTIDLLFEGYFLRGAVVKGKLYHDDKMVFGEALVDAINLEREVVKFPRVMIHSAVVGDAFRDEIWRDDLKRRISRADDGPYFLHALYDMVERVESEREKHGQDIEAENSDEIGYFVGVRDQIQQRFQEAADNPRHFEKVQWFAKYWNTTVEPLKVNGLRKIVGPGLEPPPARWG